MFFEVSDPNRFLQGQQAGYIVCKQPMNLPKSLLHNLATEVTDHAVTTFIALPPLLLHFAANKILDDPVPHFALSLNGDI